MLATAKVPNLKANHNSFTLVDDLPTAVLATAKVPNLKANHNAEHSMINSSPAVLATAKVPNLKANHNHIDITKRPTRSCVSYCESTEFES